MKILALEREVPGTPRTAFETLLRAEALRVWELHQAGIVRELYFRSDCPCAASVPGFRNLGRMLPEAWHRWQTEVVRSYDNCKSFRCPKS
jgi:hypothetical protein